MMRTAIWWLRRDLRLRDNPALSAALDYAEQVLPVFIVDPELMGSPNVSEVRVAFLWEGLCQLDASLQALGSRLIVRYGNPLHALTELANESGASKIFAERDYSPYAQRRDRQIAAQLPLELLGGTSVSHPRAVLKADGTPYVVYTPFMRAWKALYQPKREQLLATPERISTPNVLTSQPLPKEPCLPKRVPFEPGEPAALRELKAFSEGANPIIYHYAEQRDRLNLAGTSRLSPYLRFGMISAREAVVNAYEAIQSAPDSQARKGAETWLNELIWREFYISILYHYPFVLRQSFREDLRDIPWQNDPDLFQAWCDGRTGYPVVDAAMRQLVQTGWMHNRARMIVASFLVKDLLMDWRWGERWFMQHLIDGDPAANNGGWQWTAGTGTDAAPYFRIFNPILQSKKFDPDGEYIRRWIPELVSVPSQFIHAPWEMPVDLQRQVGISIGRDYPQPIIDHNFARQRTIEAYNQAKKTVQDT